MLSSLWRLAVATHGQLQDVLWIFHLHIQGLPCQFHSQLLATVISFGGVALASIKHQLPFCPCFAAQYDNVFKKERMNGRREGVDGGPGGLWFGV